MSLRFSVFIALCVSFAGCSKDNPDYCKGHPDDTTNCVPDAPEGCTGDADCSGMVCDLASSTCVQCTDSNASACTGTTPVCGDDHTCGACQSHADCAATSDVCLPTGACANADDVAYVSSTGTGTACTHAAPCPLLASAVATDKPTIKIAANGAKKDTAPVTIDGKMVTVLADPGATLDRDGDGPILEVKSAAANVTVYDLHITGATGAGADGVILTPNGGAPTLSLVRVTIDGNQGRGVAASGGTLTLSQSTIAQNTGGGVSASGGTLTISQSTIDQNTGVGVSASGGTLTVTQSTIAQNTGGGIDVGSATTFDITNCFIYRNGNQDTGTVGGVSIGGTVAGANRVAFNTIVDNRIASSGTKSGGLLCDIAGFAAPNNIIARNQSGSSTTVSNAQTLGACTYPTSKIQSDVAGLGFASAEMAPYSYKLTPDSSAVDAATTTSTVDVDFDGDTRPQGAAKDIGADELVP